MVETHIHYPTDSSLLGDGVRVVTRTLKHLEALVGHGRAHAILDLCRDAARFGAAPVNGFMDMLTAPLQSAGDDS